MKRKMKRKQKRLTNSVYVFCTSGPGNTCPHIRRQRCLHQESTNHWNGSHVSSKPGKGDILRKSRWHKKNWSIWLHANFKFREKNLPMVEIQKKDGKQILEHHGEQLLLMICKEVQMSAIKHSNRKMDKSYPLDMIYGIRRISNIKYVKFQK